MISVLLTDRPLHCGQTRTWSYCSPGPFHKRFMELSWRALNAETYL